VTKRRGRERDDRVKREGDREGSEGTGQDRYRDKVGGWKKDSRKR